MPKTIIYTNKHQSINTIPKSFLACTPIVIFCTMNGYNYSLLVNGVA